MALAFMLATRLPTSSELISPYIYNTYLASRFYFMCINNTPFGSVADSGCLSRILVFSHPGSRNPGSQISDPTTATKKRRKKFVVLRVFVAIKLAKF
jgi:hypothetical protein